MTFSEFLRLLEGPAVSTAVGLILSLLVEYWPWFCQRSPKAKRLVTGALSLAVPLAACLAGVLTGYQANDFERLWWPALQAGGIAFAAATLAHVRKLPELPAG